MRWNLRASRGNLRLASGLILLAFVICHLAAHSALLLSFDRAADALDLLMAPWRTNAGTSILAGALLVHYTNALWSIYARRSLRFSHWEWWQLALGLCIPVLLMSHVIGTRIAYMFFGVNNSYSSVLTVQWLVSPWLGAVHVAAVIVVWIHACIGIHFWLRTKRWYPPWRVYFAAFGLLLPTLALAGYVTAGNQILRVADNSDFIRRVFADANITEATFARIHKYFLIGCLIHFGLLALVFGARGLRACIDRRRRGPMLTHASGRSVPIMLGATVLETLREHGIPHASVCGGRARCTTCRIHVTKGLITLPPADGLEAKALLRIQAPPGMRLACQIMPNADITVTPLLAADATAADGTVRGGLEGSERLITVVFVDLRGSTTLGEARMPYDVLYLLNQFFSEMTKALAATNGHYSQFTGDGLMALYGLNTTDPAQGAADAVRGAREMLMRVEQLNARLQADLVQPLRIGIGIHFSEAIVGAMGPPRSQITTAIGDTVNTCARLESLTKEYNCSLVVSRGAAEMAGLDLTGETMHEAPVKGRVEKVQFYALDTVPELRA